MNVNAPRRLALILHGKAAADEAVRDAVAAVRADGHQIDLKITREEGEAEHYARQAYGAQCEGKLDTIMAGGGDGTLNAVVNGVLNAGEGPAADLALMPLGTANDFARTVGIPPNDPLAALEVALHAPARPIDVVSARIDSAEMSRWYVNMMTAGFGPRITSEADPQLKASLGGAAYLVSALGRIGEITPWEGTLTGPELDWNGSFIALAFGNGRLAGGGVELCPNAKLDDGLLDATILEAPAGDALQGLLASLPLAVGAEPESMVRTRASEFRLRTRRPVPLSLDGEMIEAREVHLKVRPRALQFHLDEASSRD